MRPRVYLEGHPPQVKDLRDSALSTVAEGPERGPRTGATPLIVLVAMPGRSGRQGLI
jgi:hypothetical protein